MKETMQSDRTGITYIPADSIRILNIKQAGFYIRLFDLDEFADSLPEDTILSVDDLFMLTFMDEAGENVVQD